MNKNYSYNLYMINFNNVKIIKKLNEGSYVSTYLCNYNNKKYTLKILHILEEDKIKDYKSPLWRSIDLFEYINTMSKDEQLFFIKLYDYQIDDNYKPMVFNNGNSKITSKICIKYLLENKNNSQELGKFISLQYEKLKIEQIYSILLQIIHINLLLYKGGYSHNELTTYNIMISDTKKDVFIMNGHKIKYNGYQLHVIQYEDIFHKKFKLRYTKENKFFLTHNKEWLLENIFQSLMDTISNIVYRVDYCQGFNKKLPWDLNDNYYEDGIKLMFNNHFDFCNEEIKKYIKIYPKGKKVIDQFLKLYKTKSNIRQLIDKKNIFYYNAIMIRLQYNFELTYPKLYIKYFSWCCLTKWILSKNECLDILQMNDENKIINYFINKM